MRFGRRDHESFIGSYDPEHEMPNPDRDPRDRWQSDAYRRNAEDSRWMYRWSPDRIESRGEMPRNYRGRDLMERDIQPRDRYESRFGGMDRGYGMERERSRWDMDRGDRYGMDRGFDRGMDRGYGMDRDRSWGRDYDLRERDLRERELRDRDLRDRDLRDRDLRDPWSSREAYDRDRFRDDWEWMGGEWDREGRYGRGGGNRY